MSVSISEVDGAGGDGVRIRVFGGLRLFHGSVEISLGPPMQQATLALLLVSRGQTVSTARIVDVLWGEGPPATARNQVQKYVGRLRRLLEPGLGIHETGRRLVATRGGYRLSTAELECDLTTFEESVANAAGATEAQAVLEAACAALRLANRGAFRDLDPGIRDREAFLAIDRSAVTAAMAAADAALELGLADEVVQDVRTAAQMAPLDEPLQARVLRLLAATGRVAEALTVYDAARRRLREDLGVDPGPQLRGEYAELLRMSVPGADPARPLEVDDTPPPRPVPRQLPGDVPGFVERSALAVVFDSLAGDRHVRVLAVSGMPGIGKTSLAVHWAHRLATQFPDGQLFVNLRGFDPGQGPVDPATVLEDWLRALGVDRDNLPSDAASLGAEFRSAVAGRQFLIVLDNARDADQVRALLPGTPETLVIVTSRHRLPGLVAREAADAVRLEPLDKSEANALLSTRLGSGRFGMLTGARDDLLSACSGLPLAITIVSARAALNPHLDINEIAAEIATAMQVVRDRRPQSGQDTDLDLVSIFDWSYDQLTPDAAELFTSLSASPNRLVSSRLAASLIGRSEEETRALARQLTDASLLEEPESGTFSLHDLLRTYAAGRLRAEGRDSLLQSRIDAYYLHSTRNAWLTAGAPSSGPELGMPPGGVIPEEFAEAAAARDWYLRDRSAIDDVTESLINRGDLRDAVSIALDRRMVSFEVDSQEKFVNVYEQALACADELGDELLIAEVRRHLGRAMSLQGDYRGGRQHLELATKAFGELGDQTGQTLCRFTLGALLLESGDAEQAQASYMEAAHRARAAGIDWLAVVSAIETAKILHLRTDHASALEWCDLASEWDRSQVHDIDIRHVRVYCYTNLGRFAEAIRVAEQDPPLYADAVLTDSDLAALPTIAYAHFRAGNTRKALAACAAYLPRVGEIRSRRHTQYIEAVDAQRVIEILEATGNEIWAASLLDPQE